MNARLLVIAVPIVLAVCMLVLVLASGRRVGLDEEDTRDDDPVLARLRERNPGLHVARGHLERLNRIPVYWVTHPEHGERLLLPRSLVDGERSAVLRLTRCDPSAIPERLRYPGAKEPICVTVEREGEHVHAFYFRTDDSMHQVVMHYDGKVGRIGSYTEEAYRHARQPEGSMEFSHAYWLYERPNPNHQVFALVGYRRERLRTGSDDSP